MRSKVSKAFIGSLALILSPLHAFSKPFNRSPANKMDTSTPIMACEDGVCRPKTSSESSKTTPASHNNSNKDESTSTKIKIDIISDTMCPWCFVGKQNLDEALKEMPEVEAEINWLPFFLNKDLPEDGMPVEEYYMRNYGNPKAGDRMKPSLVQAGKRCGIDFETNYINLTHYRPTIRSHRLVEFAKRQGKQNEMVMELFHMYYEEGKHLNSINDLADSAKKVGLTGNVKEYLESKQDEDEVFAEAARVKRLAQGVPTFLFSKPGTDIKHTFSGGQPPRAFRAVFEAFQKE